MLLQQRRDHLGDEAIHLGTQLLTPRQRIAQPRENLLERFQRRPLRIGAVASRRKPRLVPHARHQLLDDRMAEEVHLHPLDLGDHLGRRLHPGDEVVHDPVETLSHRMQRIGEHLGDQPLHATDQPVGDRVAQPHRHPARALLTHPLADRVVAILERATDELHHFVEEFLRTSTRCRDRHHLAHQRGELDPFELGHGAALDELAHLDLGERLDRAGQPSGQLLGETAAIGLLAHPGRRPLRGVNPGQPGLEHGPREEVVLDEVAEDLADPVLLLLHDGGVGDRDPQRMPKQGRHGEPVRDPAHQRGLGRGPHVGQPGIDVLVHLGHDEDDQGHHEEPGRRHLHPFQGGSAGGFVGEREGSGGHMDGESTEGWAGWVSR